MKYSDAVKAKFTATINEFASNPENYALNPGKDFLRNRKLGFNQIHINAFYSILDRRFNDLVIQPGRKRNEYSAFCQMVDAVDPDDPATIYLCDRGYASYNNFAHIIEKGQYFAIRCTDKKTEGILGFSLEGTKKLDYCVDRILSRSESKKKRLQPDKPDNYRHICKEVPMDYLSDEQLEYTVSLRIVRVEVSENNFVNIITNLPDLEFDISEFKGLYHLRWTIHDSITSLDVEGLIAQNIGAVRPGRTFARQPRFKLPLSFCYRN